MTSEPPGWSSPGSGGWSTPSSSAPPPPPSAPPGWGAPTAWGGPPVGPGYFPPRVPEVRPGVVPLRPLGIGEIIDGAISTMRRHWKLQIGLSAIVVAAVSVLQGGVLWLIYRNPSGIEGGDLTGPDTTSAAANVAQLVTVVVGQLAQMVLIGILVFIVSRAVLGEDVTPSQAWGAVKPHLWKLIALSVLVMLLMVIVIGAAILLTVLVAVAGAPTAGVVAVGVISGLVAAPAAVWLWVRLGVSAPTLVLERTGIRGAMRRSARLVRRSWWRVFGILLLSTVISTVLSGIISTPFSVFAFWLGDFDLDGNEPPNVWFYVFSTIGSSVAGALTYPFTAGVAALLYIDLRMRREALDITLVRSARAGGRA